MPNPSKTIAQLVEICRTAGYFKIHMQHNEPTAVKSLPLGQMLRENIQREWRHSFDANVVFLGDLGPDLSVLNLSGIPMVEQLQVIRKKVKIHGVPFGLAECKFGKTEDVSGEENVRLVRDATSKLACSYFTSEQTGKEFFYNMQRHRKIWWMKIAANPGRFYLSEIKSKECGGWNASILSKFEFGNVELERFELIASSKDFLLNEASSHGKRIVRPNIIRSIMCLDTSAIATLMDAIDSAYDQEICLNHKIAPYQCSIFSVLPSSGDQTPNDFSDMTKYIRMHLQRGGLSVPIETEANIACTSKALDDMLKETDRIGVPYVLILDAECLRTGLLKLRNRDTTLTETIHLSDVTKYLLNIFGIF